MARALFLIRTYGPHALVVFVAAVFLDSLRFKFTNHPNTQEIFGRLNEWAASFGADGLFAHTGLFSQYVIGSAELVASALLLLGIVPALRAFQPIGAAIGLAVMTGAISFHLFTPLGVVVNDDGGALFGAAVAVWTACLAILVIRRRTLADTASRLRNALLPAPAAA